MHEVAGETSVLVVEDEFFLADDLTSGLSGAGIQVVGPAPTVDEALRLLQQNLAVDFAVLDVNLRGQQVYEVADELRRRDIPFIFATGYDGDVIPDKYRAVPCFEKPISLGQVLSALHARNNTDIAPEERNAPPQGQARPEPDGA